MFEGLEIFGLALGLAQHAAARQSVVARNLANADTPGYKQRGLASFAEVWAQEAGGGVLKRTRRSHLTSGPGGMSASNRANARIAPSATADPNGNTVSVEAEIMKSALIKQDHDLALSIYRSGMNVLRSTLGRR